MLELISQICVDMGVDGHRADITMMKTSITLAAFNGRTEVLEEDVKEAAELVLPHRMRRKPFDNYSDKQDKLNESIEKQKEKEKKKEKEKNKNEQQKKEHSEQSGKAQAHPEEQKSDDPQDSTGEQPDASSETIFATGESYQIKQFSPDFLRNNRNGSGRRSKTLTKSTQGRYIKSKIPEEKTTDIAFDATLRAAAPYQLVREKNGNSIVIHVCFLDAIFLFVYFFFSLFIYTLYKIYILYYFLSHFLFIRTSLYSMKRIFIYFSFIVHYTGIDLDKCKFYLLLIGVSVHMPDILIKNTRIYYNNSLQSAEIIIEDGKVTKIGKDLRVSSSDMAYCSVTRG